jgi:hypothetical protein
MEFFYAMIAAMIIEIIRYAIKVGGSNSRPPNQE